MATNEKKSIAKKLILIFGVIVGAVAISVTSILATVAYLTYSAAVSNVFTIGKVGITMNESKVNPDGTIVDAGATKVDTNTYHLVPNKTYVKDPTIHVDAGSENSFLFVLVRNDLENIECKSHPEHKTIAQQLAANGWAKYTRASTGWVYVYVGAGNVPDGDASLVTASYTYAGAGMTVTAGNYLLFENFTIDSNANVDAYGAAKITLTAVAIQQSGFASLAEAWAAVIATYPYIHTGNAS